MTEKRLRELFKLWQGRLGLDDWRIDVVINSVSEETSYMENHRSAIYDRCVIHVQPWILGGDIPSSVMTPVDGFTEDFIESLVVHELLHCWTRDLKAFVDDDLDGQLHRDVHAVLRNSWSRREEQLVDRFALALVSCFS